MTYDNRTLEGCIKKRERSLGHVSAPTTPFSECFSQAFLVATLQKMTTVGRNLNSVLK